MEKLTSILADKGQMLTCWTRVSNEAPKKSNRLGTTRLDSTLPDQVKGISVGDERSN